MNILVTGAAGFIGFHVSKQLCREGNQVIGIDNLNQYYSRKLKISRLEQLARYKNFQFIKINISDRQKVKKLFSSQPFDRVIHMAAQAGVRYSIQNPHAYADSNLVGFLNILEGCRQQAVNHLIYASSSSVYGANNKLPFCTSDIADSPVSLYAATKRANELMAYVYAHLYGLPSTGLRFFTVYGPWGRPDMALFNFTRLILRGEPIELYNHGEMSRDFTYIDDLVEGIVRIQNIPPSKEAASSPAGVSANPLSIVYNLGYGKPISLVEFIHSIESATGLEAIKHYLPMQAGDIQGTWSDSDNFFQKINFKFETTVDKGVKLFVQWFRNYYHI